ANDTLAMARMEENDLTLDVEPVDFTALVSSVAAMFRDQREVKVETPPEGGPVVRADRGRIRQTLENLVGNAIKYSPKGGPVTIGIEAVDDAVRVSVSDSGIGVPPEDAERIFSRFTRAGNATHTGISGSGFGLYISEQIVRRHGGRMWVDSKLGEGSTFTVDLPLVCAVSRAPRILLADSAGSVRSLAAHALRAGGRSVKVCDKWEDLSRELASSEFDAAVIDADSFGHPGDPVQTALDQCNAARIPVVLVGAERPERFEGYAASLGKPYMIADLVETVSRLDGAPGEPDARPKLQDRYLK
ncbi:MAG: ATP-binding protein, partial [Vulcanimicrobiaceae bacterium]